MEIDGMAELSETLNQLEQGAEAVASRALYEGAGIMLKEIAAEIGKIKTAPFEYAKDGATRLPSPEEKEILVKHGSQHDDGTVPDRRSETEGFKKTYSGICTQ